MSLLAGTITHGQAVSLVLLCIFLVAFIIIDVYLVLSLRKKNKQLAKKSEQSEYSESTNTKNSDNTNY